MQIHNLTQGSPEWLAYRAKMRNASDAPAMMGCSAYKTRAELLREGGRLLQDIDAVANRVRRVATGWEPQLTLSIDGVISPHTMLELVEAFYAMSPPTRLKLRDGIMSGTREALTSGRADLAIGVSNIASDVAGLQQAPLGDLLFIYVVAPHHPLASIPEPITDAVMLRHRAVAVADSAQRGGMTMGLLGGQDVLRAAGRIFGLVVVPVGCRFDQH